MGRMSRILPERYGKECHNIRKEADTVGNVIKTSKGNTYSRKYLRIVLQSTSFFDYARQAQVTGEVAQCPQSRAVHSARSCRSSASVLVQPIHLATRTDAASLCLISCIDFGLQKASCRQ